MPTLESSSDLLSFSNREKIELNGSILGRLGAGSDDCMSKFNETDVGAIFSLLSYFRSSVNDVVDDAVVNLVVPTFNETVGFEMTVVSSVSAFRFRVSVIELLKLNDVFPVNNFELVKGDKEEVKRFDDNDVVGFGKVDDDVVVENKLLLVGFSVERLLLVNNEFVVVDDEVKRLEPLSNELLPLVKVELIVFFGVVDVDKVELVGFKRELFVDNNDDEIDVFFGSVIVFFFPLI